MAVMVYKDPYGRAKYGFGSNYSPNKCVPGNPMQRIKVEMPGPIPKAFYRAMLYLGLFCDAVYQTSKKRWPIAFLVGTGAEIVIYYAFCEDEKPTSCEIPGPNGGMPKGKKFYDDAPDWIAPPRRKDPLMLDLDGDGIKTIGIDTGIYFDHNGDGFAERTGWVNASDGMLVMDRNGDGIINDGTELFGDQSVLSNGVPATNGFEALAELDSNKDGRIDAADEAFSRLAVLACTDPEVEPFEIRLYTLEELGIASINLASVPDSTTDSQGNVRTRIGSFTMADGTTREIAEYHLEQDTTYSMAHEWLEVPDEIAALPGLQGYGTVYDLHQAMVRDTSGELKSLVERFVAEPDISTRNGLMEKILFKWTGTESIDPTSRGGNIDARKLAVLEKLFGQAFVGGGGPNPSYGPSILLNEAYRTVFEMNYAELMGQSHLADSF